MAFDHNIAVGRKFHAIEPLNQICPAVVHGFNNIEAQN